MAEAKPAQKLRGLRVVTFESRRSVEMAELIRRYGGEPVSAPAMREVPLTPDAPVFAFARRLRERGFDVVVFLTGVGTRYLAEAIASELPRADLGRLLGELTTVARGPKPVAALRELGVTPTITVPEPNTWRELLAAMDARVDLRGKRVAVQEYGEQNPELVAGLRERGGDVTPVHIYRWDLPEDLEPLRGAIREIVAGRIDAALFTNAGQAYHLFRVAGAQSDALRAAFARVVVSSIGPIASEALRRHGIEVDFEPEHPKMGAQVAQLAERAPELAKRRNPDG